MYVPLLETIKEGLRTVAFSLIELSLVQYVTLVVMCVFYDYL